MKNWKIIRRKLLFALCAAFALLFTVGMCAAVFGSADAARSAVPPFLGFCFRDYLFDDFALGDKLR